MMRNTSPVGWIPLLAIKVLREGALIPFIISGIFVALPILFATVWIDTIMYNADTWVLTGYNFLEMNILHGLSKYFGEDDFFWYFRFSIPLSLVFMYNGAMMALFWFHPRNQIHMGKTPYFTYYTLFYLGFFGLVGHKETRFTLPIWPFLMM